ncbi:MAG TPA: lactonase family protein, partial [Verrucomicrobiae bacterium]|nr:lactonase family protein [Verrucomicrobiae bacterium]
MLTTMRRTFALVAGLGLVTQVISITALGNEPGPIHSDAAPYFVYFGTYTRAESKGIYVSAFDEATGQLSAPALAAKSSNPAYLVAHPNHRFLYAVGDASGASNGVVKAFAIDKSSGLLSFLNAQPSGGSGPTHLAIDRTGACLLVANYGSGSIAALPIRANGTLGPPATSIQHHGSSVDPKRQQGPHAHCVGFDLSNQRALCADLGLDKILVYKCDASNATLSPNDPPSASVPPGAGARHFVFDANGHRLYVINEMQSSITAFHYDQTNGSLTEFQTVTTLPTTFSGTNTAAEIAIPPNGKFLYASNRGDNSIMVYSIDGVTGLLSPIQRQPSLGKTPRMFAIDPTGRFLFAANQDSHNIV